MDSYCSDFICTYQVIDNEDLYRSQFLQAFGLSQWDDQAIALATDKIFALVESELIPAFDILRGGDSRFGHMLLFMGDDLSNSNLFRVLFVYDLFYITHRCISDVLTSGRVDKERLTTLCKAIKA